MTTKKNDQAHRDSTSESAQLATASSAPATPHTPGPWVVWSEENTDATKLSVCRHVGPMDSDEHVCVAMVKGHDPATAKANARMVAAVLDLLAACRAVVEWRGCDGDGIADPVREQVIAAIVKAEGR